MKKYTYLLFALLLSTAAGCSEKIELPDTDGFIEVANGERVTVMHLTAGNIVNTADWASERNVQYVLENPAKRLTFSLEGTARHDGRAVALHTQGALCCRIVLSDTDIPDGEYYLRVIGDNIPDIGLRRVRFSNNVGAEIEAETMQYTDLTGDGTAESPYLINDDGDFATLLWYLQEDPDHAYGKYFRQTSSFDVPPRSMIIDGKVWAPMSFAGTYDGGGNSLGSLHYQGASDPVADKCVGLFSDLYSATVRNLTFSNAMILNGTDSVGILAGRASGICTFENITASGTVIASGKAVGGLVGGTDGTAVFSNITLKSLVVQGSESTTAGAGLMLGCHTGQTLTVEHVTAPDHIFNVSGCNRVGGIAGEVRCQEAHVKNITLEHSVDQESHSVKVVYGTGSYIGGLFGYFEVSGTSDITMCSVKAPVRGNQDIGGVIGHARVANLTLTQVMLSSVVDGGATVGGFFGYLGFPDSGGKMTFGGADNSSRYVVKSSADAAVSGTTYVGGAVGYFDSNHGEMVFNGKVEIAVNVSGTDYVGGAFGFARYLKNFNPYNFNFSSTTMRVKASNNGAGGVIGQGRDSSIDGKLTVKPLDNVPDKSTLQSCFSGVVTAGLAAGGFAGVFDGNVSGISCDANVTSTSGDAGGLCGNIDGVLSGCVFDGQATAKRSAGGIYAVSTSPTYVYDCVNHGEIQGEENVGGIGGYTSTPDNTTVDITRCYNDGHVKGGCTGGLFGYIGSDNTNNKKDKYDVTYCGNFGKVESNGNSDCAVGGVVARMNHRRAYIASCVNHGEVSCPRNYSVGGVVGDIGDRNGSFTNHGLVTQCANYGKVSSSDKETYVGGVVGRLHGSTVEYDHKITDCANYGDIPSDQKDDTGGILGRAEQYTNIYRTFNRGKVSHGNAIIGTHHSGTLFHHDHNYYLDGTGKSWPSSTSVKSSDINNKDIYKDFDFTYVWLMTDSGPKLRNCPWQ